MTAHQFSRTAPWYYSEQLFRSLSTLAASIYVARYLEPEQFGALSYALLFTTVFAGVSRLGMDAILIRELGEASSERSRREIFLAAFSLMFATSIICIILIFFIVFLLSGWTSTLLYTSIISLSLLFQPFQAIDYWFKAEQNPKSSAIPLIFAHITNATIKVGLVLSNAPFIHFVLAYTAEFIILAAYLTITGWRLFAHLLLFKPAIARTRKLLQSAAPLVLSTVSIVLYMRVDQFFIAEMLGQKELGLYSAATRIYEAAVMIFTIFASALLPTLVKLKASSALAYDRVVSRVFRVGFWGGITTGAGLYYLAPFIVNTLYGSTYTEASRVLSVLSISLSFTALGSLTAKYLIVENRAGKIAIRTGIALGSNLILNFFLIPVYGITGAAYSTVICLIISNLMVDFYDSELKALLRIKIRAIFYPFDTF